MRSLPSTWTIPQRLKTEEERALIQATGEAARKEHPIPRTLIPFDGGGAATSPVQ